MVWHTRPVTDGRTTPRRWRAITVRVVLAVAGLVTVMCAALLVAMVIDDARIDANRGSAVATVLSVSPLRTGIEFLDENGATVRPPTGVLYPGLLAEGQQFMVEYDRHDPATVRVAGRTAAVGVFGLSVTVAATWLVALFGVLVLRPRRRPVPATAR